LPSLAAAQLQRWAFFIEGINMTWNFNPQVSTPTPMGFHQLESLPVTAKQQRRKTSQDPIPSKVLR